MLNIYSAQSHKNELENCVPRIVENALVSAYPFGDEAAMRQRVEEDIKASLKASSNIKVDIRAIDAEKGILSVSVTEEFKQPSGTWKSIVCEKTAIMERKTVQQSKVTVQFLVNEEVYKEYQLVRGEACPVPKLPGNIYIGWAEYGQESLELIGKIEEVWEDKVYVAVTE